MTTLAEFLAPRHNFKEIVHSLEAAKDYRSVLALRILNLAFSEAMAGHEGSPALDKDAIDSLLRKATFSAEEIRGVVLQHAREIFTRAGREMTDVETLRHDFISPVIASLQEAKQHRAAYGLRLLNVAFLGVAANSKKPVIVYRRLLESLFSYASLSEAQIREAVQNHIPGLLAGPVGPANGEEAKRHPFEDKAISKSFPNLGHILMLAGILKQSQLVQMRLEEGGTTPGSAVMGVSNYFSMHTPKDPQKYPFDSPIGRIVERVIRDEFGDKGLILARSRDATKPERIRIILIGREEEQEVAQPDGSPNTEEVAGSAVEATSAGSQAETPDEVFINPFKDKVLSGVYPNLGVVLALAGVSRPSHISKIRAEEGGSAKSAVVVVSTYLSMSAPGKPERYPFDSSIGRIVEDIIRNKFGERGLEIACSREAMEIGAIKAVLLAQPAEVSEETPVEACDPTAHVTLPEVAEVGTEEALPEPPEKIPDAALTAEAPDTPLIETAEDPAIVQVDGEEGNIEITAGEVSVDIEAEPIADPPEVVSEGISAALDAAAEEMLAGPEAAEEPAADHLNGAEALADSDSVPDNAAEPQQEAAGGFGVGVFFGGAGREANRPKGPPPKVVPQERRAPPVGANFFAGKYDGRRISFDDQKADIDLTAALEAAGITSYQDLLDRRANRQLVLPVTGNVLARLQKRAKALGINSELQAGSFSAGKRTVPLDSGPRNGTHHNDASREISGNEAARIDAEIMAAVLAERRHQPVRVRTGLRYETRHRGSEPT